MTLKKKSNINYLIQSFQLVLYNKNVMTEAVVVVIVW